MGFVLSAHDNVWMVVVQRDFVINVRMEDKKNGLDVDRNYGIRRFIEKSPAAVEAGRKTRE